MKPINYQLTNSIVNNIAELEVLRTQMSGYEIDSDQIKKLEKSQKIHDIFHVADMLGIKLTLSDAEKFINGKIEIGDNNALQILNNYRNVIEYLKSNKGNSYIDINKNLLSHINKLLIHNWKDEWHARIRSDSSLEPEFDNWVLFYDETLDPLDVEKEVDSTIDWYKNNVTRINGAIRIPVFFYRILKIMPFSNLNKYSLLAICDFLLQKNEYSTSTYISVAKFFNTYKNDFSKLWRQASDSPTGNITFWIEAFLKALIEEIKQNKEQIKKEIDTKPKSSSQPFLNLNRRQLKVLKYLQTIPTVKREDYVQMFDVSTMTAYRDLNELLKKKLIKQIGQGRATKYMLANR